MYIQLYLVQREGIGIMPNPLLFVGEGEKYGSPAFETEKLALKTAVQGETANRARENFISRKIENEKVVCRLCKNCTLLQSVKQALLTCVSLQMVQRDILLISVRTLVFLVVLMLLLLQDRVLSQRRLKMQKGKWYVKHCKRLILNLYGSVVHGSLNAVNGEWGGKRIDATVDKWKQSRIWGAFRRYGLTYNVWGPLVMMWFELSCRISCVWPSQKRERRGCRCAGSHDYVSMIGGMNCCNGATFDEEEDNRRVSDKRTLVHIGDCCWNR